MLYASCVSAVNESTVNSYQQLKARAQKNFRDQQNTKQSYGNIENLKTNN